jgi:hypothetical protein
VRKLVFQVEILMVWTGTRLVPGARYLAPRSESRRKIKGSRRKMRILMCIYIYIYYIYICIYKVTTVTQLYQIWANREYIYI